MKFISLFLILFSTSLFADTLSRINQSNEINVGFRPTSIPLSFIDTEGNPQGYAIDISQQIIQSIKDKLKNPNLKVNWIKINPSTRLPLIISGKIDFECSATIKTPQREKQVAFGPTYYVAELGYLYNHTNVDIKNGVVVGKRLAVVDGTLAQYYHEKLNSNKLIHTKENAEAMLLLEQGRADVITQDDVLLASLKAKNKNKNQYTLTSNKNEVYPNACVFSKNDPEFAKLVNDTIKAYAKSGALEACYQQWFMSPIPTLNNLIINLPMNAPTQHIIRQLKE